MLVTIAVASAPTRSDLQLSRLSDRHERLSSSRVDRCKCALERATPLLFATDGLLHGAVLCGTRGRRVNTVGSTDDTCGGCPVARTGVVRWESY